MTCKCETNENTDASVQKMAAPVKLTADEAQHYSDLADDARQRREVDILRNLTDEIRTATSDLDDARAALAELQSARDAAAKPKASVLSEEQHAKIKARAKQAVDAALGHFGATFAGPMPAGLTDDDLRAIVQAAGGEVIDWAQLTDEQRASIPELVKSKGFVQIASMIQAARAKVESAARVAAQDSALAVDRKRQADAAERVMKAQAEARAERPIALNPRTGRIL